MQFKFEKKIDNSMSINVLTYLVLCTFLETLLPSVFAVLEESRPPLVGEVPKPRREHWYT
jgi:hypothetical protein